MIIKKKRLNLIAKNTAIKNNLYRISYLIIILISQRGQVTGTIIPYIPYMLHLTFVAVANPFHLLSAVVFNSVHLLGIVFPQFFKLLALVLLNVVKHLVDLLSSRRHSYTSTTQAPFAASASAKNMRKPLIKEYERENRKSLE